MIEFKVAVNNLGAPRGEMSAKLTEGGEYLTYLGVPPYRQAALRLDTSPSRGKQDQIVQVCTIQSLARLSSQVQQFIDELIRGKETKAFSGSVVNQIQNGKQLFISNFGKVSSSRKEETEQTI